MLCFCLWKFENKLALVAFLRSFFRKKVFKKDVDLSELISEASDNKDEKATVDVIIPTLGRAEHLRRVVNDLSKQSLLPKRVIIVEQNPEINSTTDLNQILKKEWPFQIVHYFTHKKGACMARNIALQEVKSEWVFLADDDIRIPEMALKQSIKEALRLRVDCLNLNCLQKGEKIVFNKIKQWGSFGSGTSILKSYFAKQIHFSESYEHGYGEDVDYGMKLRLRGCDIIYHPDIQILHLKAPVGGFREVISKPWENEDLSPKPSPTMMQYVKKYYSPEQLTGFRLRLLFEYYFRQEKKNPLVYLNEMKGRWENSEKWATKIMT